MPPTSLRDQTAKKAEKCVFFAAGLSKVMSMKNKKLPNCIRLVLIINLLSKKLPPTQNFTKKAKICIKTDLERRRVKQIYQKYRQNKWQRLSNWFQLRLLHYRSKQRLENFFSEKFREFSIGFFKKIIFY